MGQDSGEPLQMFGRYLWECWPVPLQSMMHHLSSTFRSDTEALGAVIDLNVFIAAHWWETRLCCSATFLLAVPLKSAVQIFTKECNQISREKTAQNGWHPSLVLQWRATMWEEIPSPPRCTHVFRKAMARRSCSFTPRLSAGL